MNERIDSAARSNTAEEERIQTVLIALGSARPDDGFEQRLARRLADLPMQQQKPVWKWAKLRLPLALAGGCAALLMSIAMLQPHYRGRSLVTNLKDGGSVQPKAAVAGLQSRATGAESTPVLAATDRQAARLQRAVPAMLRRPGTVRAEAVARAEIPGREASFPAPPMPLTEQEQLLLRVAHRNDPEEIAMLNPVERSLQAARERAESARFFAPAPLPPEIQQQINEALRSQYVNTPPPQELFAQITNRSTP